jgi:ParB-like chromosome segregation protein Spo0J
MSATIKHGFQRELLTLPIADLKPTKILSPISKHGKKYKQVLSSIREVGLIEPPVVSPPNRKGERLLLDGHLRIAALTELGIEQVSCLVSTDDRANASKKSEEDVEI